MFLFTRRNTWRGIKLPRQLGRAAVYLPAGIPRSLTPGMNGGESNYRAPWARGSLFTRRNPAELDSGDEWRGIKLSGALGARQFISPPESRGA